MSARKVRVTAAFPPNFFDGLTQPPLIMRIGETLEVVEKEKSERWPAFVLVLNEGEGRGWVPARYLKRQGKKALAMQRYDTTTLDPLKGDILTVMQEDLESRWLWCRDSTGKEGLFPIDSITPA